MRLDAQPEAENATDKMIKARPNLRNDGTADDLKT